MDALKTCWICGGEFPSPNPHFPSGIKVNCTLCGVYSVTESAFYGDFPLVDSERYRISHWVKQRQLDGQPAPIFNSNSILEIASALPRYEPFDKLDIMLASVGKLARHAGDWIKVDMDRHYSLACAAGKEEFQYFLDALKNLGYLQQLNEINPTIIRVTASGWKRISELREEPAQSRKAFVAMRFLPEMLEIFRGSIAPALLSAGYAAEISGAPQHNDRIDAKIMVQIKSARFVVADVSHENQGVYFEAGFALGLGRPVIWTCRKDVKDKIHFDTRQYNHILWSDADDLSAQLHDRVVATI